jgi:ADP-ribose pyrophosphatase YjhB (NUDIX family)
VTAPADPAPRPDAGRPALRALATVGALAVDPLGRGLFVRTAKWRGRWGVPGGKVEGGETLLAALRREFAEETGLTLEDVRWAPTQEAVRSPEFAKEAHFVLLNFVARTAGGEVRLNDEADAHLWLPPAEALARLELNRPTRALVQHYLAHGHAGPALVTPPEARHEGGSR